MENIASFTRREVNRALLATAFAVLGGRNTLARSATPLFDFAIAGGRYYALDSALERIAPGTTLRLVREAANPYDADAIAVNLGDTKLGYVPREANSPVARLMDNGERVIAQVSRMLDIFSWSEVPDDLAFTAFSSGDPMVRLSVAAA